MSWRICYVFAVMVHAALWLAACGGGDGLPRPDVKEPVVEGEKYRNPAGKGVVVVKLEQGTGVYFYDGPTAEPYDVNVTPLVGTLVHAQYHVVTVPKTDTKPEHDEHRWVLITQTGTGAQTKSTVTIYGADVNGPGKVERVNKKDLELPGEYNGNVYNAGTQRKSITTTGGDLTVDLVDGAAV